MRFSICIVAAAVAAAFAGPAPAQEAQKFFRMKDADRPEKGYLLAENPDDPQHVTLMTCGGELLQLNNDDVEDDPGDCGKHTGPFKAMGVIGKPIYFGQDTSVIAGFDFNPKGEINGFAVDWSKGNTTKFLTSDQWSIALKDNAYAIMATPSFDSLPSYAGE